MKNSNVLEHQVDDEPSLQVIKRAVPNHLFRSDTCTSLQYVFRDFIMAFSFGFCVLTFDEWAASTDARLGLYILRPMWWFVYWWFQGLVFTGIWVIGHECGHGAFSKYPKLCDLVGYLCHTILWTPYFSWKRTHRSHHRHHASMEKDEHWIPKTRSEVQESTKTIEYSEYLEDTPIVTALILLLQQFAGFPAYLLWNITGQKHYPKWTNHFNPFASALFKPEHRIAVLFSDLGITAMLYLVFRASGVYGGWQVFKLYGVPCLLVSHWVTMIVFLQHTDPDLPHYRKGGWSYQRGALSTMDRDFLGWQGRFFLHDIAHFHVVHHLFPQIPFYHAKEATELIKATVGEGNYHFSDKPVFRCLWENHQKCQFVEDEGDILFYKDKYGRSNHEST